MRTSRRRARRSRGRSACLPEPETLNADLERIVRRAQAEQRVPSISAALFRGRDVRWSGAVGLADVEAGREATPDTRYPIASITKSFVAVSVLQLRDAGELALEDPIARHVPDAPAGPTILTLLSHLSGIQREVPGSGWETLVFPSREELLASLGDVELVLEPGLAWHYSNLGFVLLGEAVARRSGMPIERYVEERVLRPLGLAQTTWGPLDPAALAGELAGTALDADAAEPEPWRPGELPPDDLAGVLGRWWSEGYEFVFSWRDGHLEARSVATPEWRRPAVFERVEGDRFRTVSGRERGEWLHILRGDAGTPTKLYWASYPFTRDPRPFGREQN